MAKMTDYGANVEGLRRALRSLPGEAKEQMREASEDIAGDVADDARARASGVSVAYAKYLGPTIRAGKGQVPDVKIGGSKRIAGRQGPNQKVGNLLWGLEFGGGARPSTRQFMPHLGTTGYALWPAVRAHSDETQERYSAALLDALESI